MAFHSPNNLDRLPASHAKIDELYCKFLKNQPSLSFFECQISPDMVRREQGPENQREVILLCKSTRRKEEEKKQKRRREEKKMVFFTSEKITKERCCGAKLKEQKTGKRGVSSRDKEMVWQTKTRRTAERRKKGSSFTFFLCVTRSQLLLFPERTCNPPNHRYSVVINSSSSVGEER